MSDLAKRLREIAKQYKCPWGDPGSNPDYFSVKDYKDVRKAATEIERLRELKTPASRQLLNITKALLEEANAESAELLAALKPFALKYNALSLSAALGHIGREHLIAAHDAAAEAEGK